ncbi:MAG: HAD-IA family hydrolase [Candidatus Moraniibacteriota bacterium]
MNKKISLDKYKHISFDLDGTLVHTLEEYRFKVVPKVVKQLGGKIKYKHSVNKFWFEAGRDKTIKEEFNLDPETFWDLFKKIDTPNKRSSHTFAYPDAEPTLRFLKKINKIISIITGARDWIARMEIEKLNGAPYDFYLSLYDSDFNEKPDPAGLKFAMKKTQTNPGETLYVGNSNEDAYFAKNAGVDFLYLCRKEHNFDLRDYSIGKIHSLDELIF